MTNINKQNLVKKTKLPEIVVDFSKNPYGEIINKS